MSHFMFVFILAASMFAGSASAEEPSTTTTLVAFATTPDSKPQATGHGAIADYCREKFAKRRARMACEVNVRLDTERNTDAWIKAITVDSMWDYGKFAELTEEIKKLKVRVGDLEDQLKTAQAPATAPGN